MTKQMYCPMSFSNALNWNEGKFEPMECTPDCAWAVKGEKEYVCAIAFRSVYRSSGVDINSKKLKDDAE